MTETLETQIARHEAIQNAPEHKDHTICSRRVDTWKDLETGSYIACLGEAMTQGQTEESALKAAESMIQMHAKWARPASETRLREGLRELVEKLELLDKSEELKIIFVFAHVHGMVYAGPNWEKELKAGRALLSLEGDKTAGVAASPEAKHGE